MQIKNFLLSTVAFTALSGAAHALYTIGDNSELFLTGTAAVKYDDNIFLSDANTKSDEIFDLTPGAEWDFGNSALTTGSLAYTEDFSIYAYHHRLNTDLANVAYKSTYSDDKLTIDLGAGYHQLNQNTVDSRSDNNLIRQNDTDFNFDARSDLTEKTSFGLGLTYENDDYRSSGYDSSRNYVVPVNYYYAITPKVDLSAGVQVGYSRLATQGQVNHSYFYNVGAHGEFTPKLSGDVNVGVDEIHYGGNGGQSQSGLGIDSKLTYLVTAKTTASLDVGNEFISNPQGSAEKDLNISFGVKTQVLDELDVFVSESFRRIGYFAVPPVSAARTDHYYETALGIDYTFSSHLTFSALYKNRQLTSDAANIPFTDNLLQFAANLRF